MGNKFKDGDWVYRTRPNGGYRVQGSIGIVAHWAFNPKYTGNMTDYNVDEYISVIWIKRVLVHDKGTEDGSVFLANYFRLCTPEEIKLIEQ